MRRFWVNGEGRLRTGWRLVIGAAAGFGTLAGVVLLAGSGFDKLFAAWGVTNDNLVYAPLYAQRIVYLHSDIVYALAYALSIIVSLRVAKRWTQPAANDVKTAGFAALTGIVSGALLTAAALMADSMRLEWPMREAALSLGLASAVVVLVLGCLCREVLGKRLIFDQLKQRFGRLAAYLALAVIGALVNTTWLGRVNSVLLAVIGCVLYERGGVWASAALQAGWMIWTKTVFAWPDGGSCLYRMYTVSDAWLTGGNSGAAAGFGCTVIWTIIAAVLLRGEVKNRIARMKNRRNTHGKDSHRDRRSGLER